MLLDLSSIPDFCVFTSDSQRLQPFALGGWSVIGMLVFERSPERVSVPWERCLTDRLDNSYLICGRSLIKTFLRCMLQRVADCSATGHLFV